MPVMDGLEAAEKIFALDLGVPIVAMTANIMASDMEVYRMSGMHDCVSKPFTSRELWRCLMKYFTPVLWRKEDVVLRDKANSALLQRLKLAYRLAHTLKSNAGQLNKTFLQQAAADIESSLKDNKNLVTPEQMTILEAELNEVLSQFTRELEATTVAPQKPPEPQQLLDTQSALELVEKLKPMLEMGDPKCQTFIGDINMIPGNEGPLITLLIQQIEDFDFESAAVSLAELKKKLEEA
jgi:CheY-like chemotaxis protein